ncbi:hypothetical protein ACSBR1_036077 [Camellia fascicularis]
MTDPILERLRRLWDLWDIRVLVLLSLNLQIILFYLWQSQKVHVIDMAQHVCLVGLLADWVATFALGNLSRAQRDHNVVDNSNALGAIWAPLLLLHLGGSDTITAYSLEDYQLWLRQLMGLSVQAFVAINAIFMSWRNYSWFSYLSIPALVAGILKYAERVWVLMSASNDKSGDIVPFDNNLIVASFDGRTTEEDTYVSALVMA